MLLARQQYRAGWHQQGLVWPGPIHACFLARHRIDESDERAETVRIQIDHRSICVNGDIMRADRLVCSLRLKRSRIASCHLRTWQKLNATSTSGLKYLTAIGCIEIGGWEIERVGEYMV